MRRDVYLRHRAPGFSIVSGCAVDEILDDRPEDEGYFVRRHHALLLRTPGEEPMIVRIVADEPLREDEQREWLARVRSHLDVADGRVLVMSGYDRAVLQEWQDTAGPDDDGNGVAVVKVDIGLWDVDVYTYAGSPAGNALLGTAGPAAQRFRRDHAGTAFPLWLARIADDDDTQDPGHEGDWLDVAGSLAAHRLNIDRDTRGFVGMLVHIHQRVEGEDDVAEGTWFSANTGARIPGAFPAGLPADREDPLLVALERRMA